MIAPVGWFEGKGVFVGRSVLLVLVLALLAFGCSSGNEKQRNDQPARETTNERSAPKEETTSPRERTGEETTAFEFSVGRTPMDEEEDDRDVMRQREVVVEPTPQEAPPAKEKAQPEPQAPEEDAPPEPDQPAVECRFFTQSEFASATPEQKTFIQECDRAAGRTGIAPAPSPPSAPISPPAAPQSQPAGGDCPGGAPIKGNQSGIYHVPGGQFYDRTNAEQCFATESDAQDAGYRRSQR